MNQPLVSIITPMYNSSATIEETLKSVQAQTFKDWEFLCVIDDGTKDNSPEIVKKYSAADARIQLLHVKNGRGCGLARNFGMKQAKGKFLAFVDADDVWLPEKLQKQISFMQKNNHAFTCTGFQRMSNEGEVHQHSFLPPEKIEYAQLCKNNTICSPSVVIDRLQTGDFEMANTSVEDFILWLQLMRKGFPCYGLREVLVHYRLSVNSRSTERFVTMRGRWRAYRNFEKISLMKSTYYFLFYVYGALAKRSKS